MGKVQWWIAVLVLGAGSYGLLWLLSPSLPRATGEEYWKAALELPGGEGINPSGDVVTRSPLQGDFYVVRNAWRERAWARLECVSAAEVEKAQPGSLAALPQGDAIYSDLLNRTQSPSLTPFQVSAAWFRALEAHQPRFAGRSADASDELMSSLARSMRERRVIYAELLLWCVGALSLLGFTRREPTLRRNAGRAARTSLLLVVLVTLRALLFMRIKARWPDLEPTPIAWASWSLMVAGGVVFLISAHVWLFALTSGWKRRGQLGARIVEAALLALPSALVLRGATIVLAEQLEIDLKDLGGSLVVPFSLAFNLTLLVPPALAWFWIRTRWNSGLQAQGVPRVEATPQRTHDESS